MHGCTHCQRTEQFGAQPQQPRVVMETHQSASSSPLTRGVRMRKCAWCLNFEFSKTRKRSDIRLILFTVASGGFQTSRNCVRHSTVEHCIAYSSRDTKQNLHHESPKQCHCLCSGGGENFLPKFSPSKNFPLFRKYFFQNTKSVAKNPIMLKCGAKLEFWAPAIISSARNLQGCPSENCTFLHSTSAVCRDFAVPKHGRNENQPCRKNARVRLLHSPSLPIACSQNFPLLGSWDSHFHGHL